MSSSYIYSSFQTFVLTYWDLLQRGLHGQRRHRGQHEVGEADDEAPGAEQRHPVHPLVQELPGERSHKRVDSAVNNKQQAGLDIIDVLSDPSI